MPSVPNFSGTDTSVFGTAFRVLILICVWATAGTAQSKATATRTGRPKMQRRIRRLKISCNIDAILNLGSHGAHKEIEGVFLAFSRSVG